MELKTHDSKKFITVLSDGRFHQTVPEGTLGAIIREYEDKSGTKHSKTELVYDEVSGKITNISFQDGEYGKNLQIELDGEGVISLGTTGNFGEDLMKKLPNINYNEPVKLVPYSFVDDKNKNRKGITVYQGENKINSFYWDADSKKSCNGIPEVDGNAEDFDSDDWKMHFMKVRKFLINEVAKLDLYNQAPTKLDEF